MVLPVSGSITANDIQGEFGQTQGGAFRIQDYYRSGSIVPNTPARVARAEIQQIPFSTTGTANTVSGGTDEVISLTLDDRFNSGLAAGTFPATGGTAFSFAGSITVDGGIPDVAAGAMTINGGVSTWTDRGTFTVGTQSYRIIRYDGTSPIQVSRVDISLNVTEATTEDEISLFTFANFGTESNIRDNSSCLLYTSPSPRDS